MAHSYFTWDDEDRTVLASFKYGFDTVFITVLILLATPVIVLPVFLYIFDAFASRKYVETNVISVDPKGFSTNELFLINAKQSTEGCQIKSVPIKEKPLNIPNGSHIVLPFIENEEVECTAKNLLASDTKSVIGNTFPLKVVQICEYKDLTNLSDVVE